MILRRLTDFILRSRYQAMLLAFVLAFIPLIGSLSILIAAFVTLRKGVFEGLLVLIAATLPNGLAYYSYVQSGNLTELESVALIVVIASNILTWGLAAILRRFANWSFVLEIAAVVGIIAVIIVHIVYPDIVGWWQTQLTTYLQKTESALVAATDKELVANQTDVVGAMKHYATGVIVASILLNALVQVLVARWWQAVMYNPTGLKRELYRIRLGHVATFVFLVCLGLFYWGMPGLSDIMPVLYLVFCLAGLSLLHYLAVPARFGWLWLLIIYVTIIGLFPIGVICVAFVALLDTVLDIRERFNKTLQ